jgi:hypothetical protein
VGLPMEEFDLTKSFDELLNATEASKGAALKAPEPWSLDNKLDPADQKRLKAVVPRQRLVLRPAHCELRSRKRLAGPSSMAFHTSLKR